MTASADLRDLLGITEVATLDRRHFSVIRPCHTSAVVMLREGVVPVRVGEHREKLLAIQRGEVKWEEVDAWRVKLHEEFDAAFLGTTLPERPDYARVNDFLVRARRGMVIPGA